MNVENAKTTRKEDMVCVFHGDHDKMLNEILSEVKKTNIRLEKGDGVFAVINTKINNHEKRLNKIESNTNRIVVSLVISAIIAAFGFVYKYGSNAHDNQTPQQPKNPKPGGTP